VGEKTGKGCPKGGGPEGEDKRASQKRKKCWGGPNQVGRTPVQPKTGENLSITKKGGTTHDN